MHKRVVITTGTIAAIAAFLMLQLTTPQMIGPLGVLIFFVLVYIAFACVTYLGLISLIGILKKILPRGKWLLALEGTSRAKVYYYASTIALAPVILLGMSSVGSVRVLDVGLLLLFELIACFYISRRF